MKGVEAIFVLAFGVYELEIRSLSINSVIALFYLVLVFIKKMMFNIIHIDVVMVFIFRTSAGMILTNHNFHIVVCLYLLLKKSDEYAYTHRSIHM